MKELIPAAVRLANQIHWGQVDKSGEPYIWHPMRVALQMASPLDQIVALLHDTVEDTIAPTPQAVQNEIYATFGITVGDAIKAISKRKNEYLQHYWERVAMNPVAREVKLADIQDNCDRLWKIEDEGTRLRLQTKYDRALEALR